MAALKKKDFEYRIKSDDRNISDLIHESNNILFPAFSASEEIIDIIKDDNFTRDEIRQEVEKILNTLDRYRKHNQMYNFTFSGALDCGPGETILKTIIEKSIYLRKKNLLRRGVSFESKVQGPILIEENGAYLVRLLVEVYDRLLDMLESGWLLKKIFVDAKLDNEKTIINIGSDRKRMEKDSFNQSFIDYDFINVLLKKTGAEIELLDGDEKYFLTIILK